MKNKFALVLSLLSVACAAPPHDAATADVVVDIVRAADRFLGQLSPEQRKHAWRGLDDPEAMTWQFVPGRYAGIEFGDLEPVQRSFAREVLRAMLSHVGFERTFAVVSLENVLHEMEGQGGRDVSHRDPGRYALLFCGRPEVGGTFVVRFQGHHVSLRLSVVDGVLAGFTPHFLGANPHRMAEPEAQGLGVRLLSINLHAEEDVTRELMASLNDAERARAVIAAEAPRDVLLGPGTEPGALGARVGLPYAEMSAEARQLLWKLLRVYVDRYRGEIAVTELERIRREELSALTFAWAGSLEQGRGHYYRIHGAHFAIEYDNTQDGANHVHTVWRDFDRDFGGDPLREHLRSAHGQ